MEARRFAEESEEPFSGRISDAFSITGQGTTVIVEDFVGKPLPGQQLEVVHDGEVIGLVELTGVGQGLRSADESIVALHFTGMPEVRLARGQILRTPPPKEEARAVVHAEDRFVPRLAAFVPAAGWTLIAAILTLAVWCTFYSTAVQGVLKAPRWLLSAWLGFTLAFGFLVMTIAAVWLTALLWLRRLGGRK